MAKVSGVGDYFGCDDSGGTERDLSNDVTSVTFNQGQNLQDITGLDKSAIERLALLGDITLTISGVFNSASNKSHAVFSNLANTRSIRYCVGGDSSSNPELNAEILLGSDDLSRGGDGSLTFSVSGSLANGTVPTWTTV